eukprot:COSAG02_NODE_7002_length_3233_cov_3.705807_1_plen_52_part_10
MGSVKIAVLNGLIQYGAHNFHGGRDECGTAGQSTVESVLGSPASGGSTRLLY